MFAFDHGSISGVLALLVRLYGLVMLVWVVASWLPRLRHQPAVRWVGQLCEPVLRPIRRVLPTAGGLDFSPLLVLLALEILARWLQRSPF
jgi:YggT family protein